MKLNEVLDGIKVFLNHEPTIKVVIQSKNSFNRADTITEVILKLEHAKQLFGDYEIIISSLDTYGEFNSSCIKCLVIAK